MEIPEEILIVKERTLSSDCLLRSGEVWLSSFLLLGMTRIATIPGVRGPQFKGNVNVNELSTGGSRQARDLQECQGA